ncbi:chromatin binding protein [Mycoemilia scoparia]|uniref:Chromatin binding protein n=1 Tax=Mycoemilia scoparia TaxID=417184 RepID=A0A9W7ZP44_9FUNG|nr:chromatin binding protein [Mycoemilia scoparia]
MCQPSFIACPAKSSPVIVEYTNAGLPPILHYITLGATSLSISSGEPPNNVPILRVISATENIDSDTENIKVEFNVLAKIQDHVNRVQWSQACFSSSGEFVVAGSCHRAEHHIYVWDKISGSLVKMLTGPHELLEDISVHPIRPIFASISTFGMIYMWTRKPQQNWSAFAPGFRELEENIDYSEPETEFDKNPTSTKNKLDSKDDSMKDMGEEVDIMGCDPLFSDSDASDSDKLDHIPMTPTYDIDYEHYNVDNKDEDQNSNIDVEGSMPDKNTSSAQSDVMKDSFSINNTVEIGEVNPSTNVPPNEAYNTKAEFGDNKPLTPLHPTQDIKTDGQPNPPEKNASTEIMIKDLLN